LYASRLPLANARLSMERVDLEAYLADPVGRWTAGEGWLHFCATEPSLAGATIWGTLGASSCQALLQCVTAAPERHAALVDGRRMHSVDAASFALAIEYIVRHRELLTARVTRLAAVRPSGINSSLPSDGFQVVTTPYPATIFSERRESLQWLGCEGHAHVIDGIERRALSVVPGPSVRQRLQELITENPATMSREQAARSLGMSLRSLQRRLGEEGATFQHELSAGRVRLAQRLMLESDASLARIAFDVGFNSPAVFSVVFRKLVGESPSEWRDARWGVPRRDSRPRVEQDASRP
jgi:AraC-like DNA-binding protein